MHHIERGSGAPPIVFVHGFTCDLTDWDAQMAAFSPQHRAVACDLRGHGKTPGTPEECSIDVFGADVASLVESLDLHDAILVGHSLGCRVVLQAARNVSSRVAGVVLIDGSRLGTGDPDAAERTTRAKIEAAGFAKFAAGMFEQMFVASTPAPLKARIVERATRMPAALGTALFPRTPAWDAKNLERALSETRQPLLVLQSTTINAQGQRVPMAPGVAAPYLDLVRSAAPHARIDTIATVGHFAQIEAAAWVNQHLATLIASAVR